MSEDKISTSKEIWKPVVGYQGIYEVSSMGRIRSLDRVQVYNGRWGKTRRKLKGCNMRPRTSSNGYKNITLVDIGRSYTDAVHRLVALAFIPNPLGLPLVDHIDDDKSNNEVSNLQWTTYAGNNRKGKATILQAHQVLEMRRRHADGEVPVDIAKDYPVKLNTVYGILRGRSWTTV